MARLAPKPYPGQWQFSQGEQIDAYLKRTDALFAELQKQSEQVADRLMENAEASAVGLLLQFPAADGYAIYVVSKDNPLTLQHVPHGDAWQVPAAHLRGIRRSDILMEARRIARSPFRKRHA